MARERPFTHDLWGAWMLLWSWAPIAATAWLFHARPSPWTFALAFVIAAGRQHALFVVTHEAFHQNLVRGKRGNEVLGAWLASYPIIMAFTAARAGHWEHHRNFPNDADPDRYAWDWRVTEKRAFVLHVLGTLTGIPFVVRAASALVGRKVSGVPSEASSRRDQVRPAAGGASKVELLKIAVTHLALLGIYAGTIGWPWYFALWLLPAISLRVAIDEMRQFLEHRDGTVCVYRAGPIERFFLGPFNFHLHGVHHALAAEPWFRLAAAEEAARAKMPMLTKRSYARDLVRYFRGIPGDQA